MIFVASPYSSSLPLVQAERYHAVMDFCAQRLRAGDLVFSPIVHCHALAHKHELPTDADYWINYSRTFIDRAASVYVYCYEGWRFSRGVAMELKYAKSKMIPIRYWHSDGTFIGEVPDLGQDN